MFLLDDGATDTGLAERMYHLLRQNLEQKPQKLSPFKTLHFNVTIVAEDIEITITFWKSQDQRNVQPSLLIDLSEQSIFRE